MNKYFVIALIILKNSTLFAQENVGQDDNYFNTFSLMVEKKITIIQPPELEQLVNYHIKYNKQYSGMNGYRIQIFSDSDEGARKRALDVRSDFMLKFDTLNIEAYLENVHVNFVVTIGDFRNKSEALKIFNIIKTTYPTAYIKETIINLPKLY